MVKKQRQPKRRRNASATNTPPAMQNTALQRSAAARAVEGKGNKRLFTLWLERASVVYIALPLLIFLLGFLSWGWALASAVSLVAAVGLALYSPPPAFAPGGTDLIPQGGVISRGHIAVCLLASIAVCAWLGAGGWGHEGWDTVKHDGMLTELSFKAWPPLWEVDGRPLFVVYYIAYYLPAAVVGQLFGFAAANQAMFVWSTFGVFLSLLWVFVFSQTAAKWIIALFFLFSGMDIVGVFVMEWLQPGRPWTHTAFDCAAASPLEGPYPFSCQQKSLDNWGPQYEFSSHLTMINWIPHQAIPGWLLTGLLLKSAAYGQLERRVLPIVTLCLLWSVLTAIGLAVYIALHFAWRAFMVCKRRNAPALLQYVRKYFSPEAALVVLPLVILLVYFLGGGGEGALPFLFQQPQYFPQGRIIVLLLDFMLLWLALFGAHRAMQRRGASWLEGGFKEMFVLVLLSVFAVSFFTEKDPQRNASIVFLFMLMVAAVRMLETWAGVQSGAQHNSRMAKALKPFAVAVVIMLCIGAWTPFIRMNAALAAVYMRGGISELHKPVAPFDLLTHNFILNRRIRSNHYARPLDDPFYRYFARKAEPQPD